MIRYGAVLTKTLRSDMVAGFQVFSTGDSGGRKDMDNIFEKRLSNFPTVFRITRCGVE